MKKIIAVLLLILLFCSCQNDIPGGIKSFDDYKKELSAEEIKKARANAGNELAERPDENICYVTVNCQKAVESSELNETMRSILPKDGIVLDRYEVRYDDGASAFDVILKAVKDNKIHMEYTGSKKAPYIEGAVNLYEFDCGALSGWMYRVNGWSPSFGMGQYEIERGDMIELIYSCELGKDIGDNYME